jgi:hypothetical protein
MGLRRPSYVLMAGRDLLYAGNNEPMHSLASSIFRAPHQILSRSLQPSFIGNLLDGWVAPALSAVVAP